MKRSQSTSERRTLSAPSTSPWTRPPRRAGLRGAADRAAAAGSSCLDFLASLPWVDVGSGLPPSAKTTRMIINILALHGGSQLDGLTSILPYVATKMWKYAVHSKSG